MTPAVSTRAHHPLRALEAITSRVRIDEHAEKSQRGPRRVACPLNDSRLLAHLAGGTPIGVYPMLPGERTTKVALLDLDSHRGETPWPTMCEEALRVIDALEAAGMHPVAYRSSGGKGVHLYLVWDQAQDAHSVRKFLQLLLKNLGYRDGTAGVGAKEIEVFPKQDYVAPGRFGSMFILPLAGESEPMEWLTGDLELMGREYAPLIDWHPSAVVPKIESTHPKMQLSDGRTSLGMLRSALAAIPDDVISAMDYDEWRNHIFGIHHASDGSDEGLALALAFSERSLKHDGGHQLEDRTWPYISSDRPGALTAEYVFKSAQRFGFNDHVLSAFEADDGTSAALMQHPTQDNVAIVFRRQFAGRLLFAHLYGRWLEWDGTRWAQEETDRAFDYAREIARRMNREGKTSIASASFCSGVERFARADRALAARGDEFDRDNYLLNTPAGTFDLRNNTLRAHSPDDRITKSTAVAPSPYGGVRFLRFLDEITGGDASLARFLQVSLGACLSGAVESHWMLFWTGAGRKREKHLG